MKTDDLLNPNRILDTIDGCVHSQGVKIDHRAWLDLGSKEWDETPDFVKAAAYIAAKATGWSDSVLKEQMCKKYEHLSETTIGTALVILQTAAEEHKIEIEKTYETLDVSKIEIRRPQTPKGSSNE